MFRRELAAALGGAGVHHRRVGALDRLGREVALGDLVEPAVVVEGVVLGPQPLDDGEPFLGAGVAVLVAQHRAAEHVDLGLVPSGHDVERVAAARNMVDHGRLLGGDDRMVERDMRGGEHARLAGRGRHAGRPGIGLEARSLRIGGAAEAVPARDRHDRLELHLLGEPGERDRVGPGDVEPAVEVRHHAAAVEVGLERAELELAGAEGRIGLAPIPLPACTGNHGRF